MQNLIDRNLLNGGLVRLTPHLVTRYNECLISLGLEATSLTEIDVDGLGVSPQIAKERNNPHYLCAGFSNPFAIIVSPDQYDKPVYFPIFSWQRALMRAFFDKNQKPIRDITGTHPIGLDIENGLSTFEGPEDLLLLSGLTAIPHIEEITEAAAEQGRLITQFSGELNCLREEVCDELVRHRQVHGDLRKRKIDMAPLTFDSFDDFYTVAFNGAAVLRHVDGDDILVLEDPAMFDSVNRKKIGSAQVYYLYDPDFSLFTKLLKGKWIVIPTKKYRQDPQLLEFKKELLLADALCDCEGSVKWRSLTISARKALIGKHKDKVPVIYSELERYAAGLKSGRELSISPELQYFLAEPSEKQSPETRQVLWTLLTHRERRNLLALYTVDKNMFLARYQDWSETKREWAANYLEERYKHQHRTQQSL